MTNEEWMKEAERLAMDFAHCYAFVGDETMPKAKAALMAHLSARPLPQATLSEEPSDEEIDRIAGSMYTPIGFNGHPSQFAGWCREFARAVLAAARQVAAPFDKEAWIEAVWAAMRDLAQDGSGSVKAMNIHTVRLFCEESWKRAASPSPVGQEEPGCASGGSDGVEGRKP